MPTILFLSVIVTLSAAPPASTPRTCEHYRPDTVRVTGKLARYTFYGAPGFGESPQRDAKEIGFYLDLPTPMCTVAGHDDPALQTVNRLQLVLDSAGFARLRPFIGKRVTIAGTLLAAFTGHHHAPALLDVVTPVEVK